MRPQLSISMLVSDRGNTLERCLDSLLPLLRELNSELIVVYTGTEKKTLEIAKRYTDQIIPFEWCGDFSKARNVGLERAKGEWFLYLDDDEWFGDVDEIVQFFKSGDYLNYNAATYIQRNYNDWEGMYYGDCSVARMVRMFPDTKFQFPIHECLTPLMQPVKEFRAFVHHYGYVQKGEEIPRFDRNVPLLLEGLKEDPKSFHFCMQLAQEYKNAKDYEEAIYYCRKGLELTKNDKRSYLTEFWMMVYLPILIALSGENEEAVKEAERLLLSPRTCDLVSAYLYITLVSLCYELKEYRKALDYVGYYQETLKYLNENPESTKYQVGNEFSIPELKKKSYALYINGLFCAMEVSDKDMVRDILSWIPWEDKSLVKLYYPHLEKWKTKYKKEKDFIEETYYGIDCSNPYVDWQKALYADKNLDKGTAERFWLASSEKYIPELLAPMLEMAVNNGFELEPLTDQISLELWGSCCVGLAEKVPTEEMGDFYDKASKKLENYLFFNDRLKQVFLEKQLSQGLLERSEMLRLLEEYCDNTLEMARKLYREECFQPPLFDCIPAQCRFAVLVKDAVCDVENGVLEEGIRTLKEALHVYPRMSVAVRHLLLYVKEQLEHPKQNVSEEFLVMGEQVKQKIAELIEQRQWNAAYSLVVRLVEIIPDDLECIRLKQMILTEKGAEEV